MTYSNTLRCVVSHSRNPRYLDGCLLNILNMLKHRGVKTLASCCGHGKYPLTIIVDVKGFPVDLFTGIRIPRKKKFYKKDREGLYYIPEVLSLVSSATLKSGVSAKRFL